MVKEITLMTGDEFSNKLFEGIYYSRFVASYMNVKGKIRRKEFMDWLDQLIINGQKIPEDVQREIANYGTNGKLELEANCRLFFK